MAVCDLHLEPEPVPDGMVFGHLWFAHPEIAENRLRLAAGPEGALMTVVSETCFNDRPDRCDDPACKAFEHRNQSFTYSHGWEPALDDWDDEEDW